MKQEAGRLKFEVEVGNRSRRDAACCVSLYFALVGIDRRALCETKKSPTHSLRKIKMN